MPHPGRCWWRAHHGMRLLRHCRGCHTHHASPLALPWPEPCARDMSQPPRHPPPCPCKPDQPSARSGHHGERYPRCPADCDTQPQPFTNYGSAPKQSCSCNNNTSTTNNTEIESRGVPILTSAPTPCNRHSNREALVKQYGGQVSSNVQTVPYSCDVCSSQTTDPIFTTSVTTEPFETCPANRVSLTTLSSNDESTDPGNQTLNMPCTTTTCYIGPPAIQSNENLAPNVQAEPRQQVISCKTCQDCITVKFAAQNNQTLASNIQGEPQFHSTPYKTFNPSEVENNQTMAPIANVKPLRQFTPSKTCPFNPCEVESNETSAPITNIESLRQFTPCEICPFDSSEVENNQTMASSTNIKPLRQFTPCEICPFDDENNQTMASSTNIKPLRQFTPCEICPFDASEHENNKTMAPITNIKQLHQFAPSKTCPFDSSEDENNQTMAPITKNKQLYQFTPSQTCTFEASGPQNNQSEFKFPSNEPCACSTGPSTTDQHHLLASNVQAQPFQVKSREACSNNQTSTSELRQYNLCRSCASQQTSASKQSCPNTCPAKVSTVTSCENWENFVSALVKENMQSILNEANMQCLDSCPSKPQYKPNGIVLEEIGEPSDIPTATSLNADYCSSHVANTVEVTNPDISVENPGSSPAMKLGDEICTTGACLKKETGDNCTCHYPPAFNQFACTGKITGTCDCGNET